VRDAVVRHSTRFRWTEAAVASRPAAGQAVGLMAGQNAWLEFFNNVIKPPLCIAASVCAVAGFLLSYGRPRKEAGQKQEATTR